MYRLQRIRSVISAVGITQLSASGTVVPNLTAYHAAFIAAAAAIALIAACIGLAVRNSDAVATMRRKTSPAGQESISDQAPVTGAGRL